MRPPTYLSTLILIGISFCVHAQKKTPTPFYISGQLQLGLNHSTIESNRTDWLTAFGPSASLQLGLNYRMNEQMFGVYGGLQLHQLDYFLDRSEVSSMYRLSYYVPTIEAKYWRAYPLKNNPSDLTPSIAVGYTPVGDDYLQTVGEHFTADAYAIKGHDIFVRPGIGLSRKKGSGVRHFFSHLSLNYTWFPASREFIYVELTNNDPSTLPANQTDPTTVSTFRGNYFSLGVEMCFNKAKRELELPVIPPDLMTRKERINKRISLPHRKVTIKVWDDKNEDGDTISIVVNGAVVLKEHLLTHRKKKIRVHLREGENVIKVIAHNEGTEGKNTCAIKFKSGWARKQLIFESAMDVSEGAILDVDD